MTRIFIQTCEFTRNWDDLGFKDDDLQRLELELLKNPKAGAVIRGTGKLRKLRFAFKNEGKSGSTRVCYIDFMEQKVIYLITVYPKNQKDNLTKAERNQIKKMIAILEQSLGQEGDWTNE